MNLKIRKIVSVIFAIFFCAIIQNSFTSCTKTNTVTKTIIDTVTVIQKDTLLEKDTALTAAILTANSWKIQFNRSVIGNDTFYYVRGGTSNSINFDNEYITFNTNNTGTYTDNFGTQTTFTWNFTNATNTTLSWTWNLSTPIVVFWENIYYKNGTLRYDEYSNRSGQYEESFEIRIPK